MTSLIPLLIILLLSQESVPIRQHYSYAILARAVDVRGQAVPNATMEVRRVPGDRGSDLSTTWYADSYGDFRVIVNESDLFSSERIVIVRAPVPPNSLVLEPPCYESNNEAALCQPGRRVTITRKGIVDLGDIDVQHLVCGTALTVTRSFDQTQLSTLAGWMHLRVRIRDERGNVGAEHRLTSGDVDRCVDFCEPQLRLALPPGTWTVEASQDDDINKWAPMGNQLVVHDDCNPLTIVVRKAPLQTTRPN